MVINDSQKLIFFMTPRCSSTTLHELITSNFTGCRTVTSTTSAGVVHHHTRMAGMWENKYCKYTAVVPTRPLLEWAVSCYNNFVGNFPHYNFSSSFDDFVVNMRGIDTRYGDEMTGFNWFQHSPQNMIALGRGRLPNFTRIVTLRHDHLMEDMWQIIESGFHRNMLIPNVRRNSCHPVAKVNISDDVKRAIVKLCCPFGEGWDEKQRAKIAKLP